MAAASATESKLLKRDTMLNDLEDLDPGTLNKVNDFVDDDLLSCFLWAAGENAGITTCDSAKFHKVTGTLPSSSIETNRVSTAGAG